MASLVEAQSPPFVVAKDALKEDLGGGITRQILGYGREIMSVRIWFETGAIGAVHTHPHSQTTYIESGRFEGFVDGTKCVLGAGDCIYIAPGLEHGIECLEAGSLIDNFSPVREDFLGQGN